jgi:TetR/AcrR family transcriptional repressor of nem operon
MPPNLIPDESRLTEKGRATRARIVAVAADLMRERGVARTGVDEVRREASVSGSQMSHYFGDKRSLVRAVIAYQADAVIAFQQPIIDHLDSFEALHAWCDAGVASHEQRNCEGGCEFGSLASELADQDEDARVDLANGFQRWEQLIRDGLATMRDRGELRPEADPEALALAFLSAIQGGRLLAQTFRSSAPLRASLDAMLAHVASFAPTPESNSGN